MTPSSAPPPTAGRDGADLLPADALWDVDDAPASAAEETTRGRPAAPRGARRGAWYRVRSVLFWVHLAAGVTAGVAILAMCATGVVLAYQRQMNEWAVARQMPAAPAGAARLPLDTLAARAAVSAPAGMRATGVTLRADPRAPVAVALEGRGPGAGRGGAPGAGPGPGAGRRSAWVDPVSGAVLPGSPQLQAFFGANERLHRSLMIGRGMRSSQGAAVTGAANLAFFFLLLSGLYLWVPRRWTRRAVRAVALPTRGARGLARDWNWHHVMGLWAAPGLAVVVGSAAFLSYQWPERLVARAAGVPVRTEGPGGERPGGEGGPRGEAPRGAGGRGEGRRGESGRGERARGGRGEGARGGDGEGIGVSEAAIVPRASLDTLAARAVGAVAPNGWYSVQLRLPAPGAARAEVAATVSTARALRPDRRTTVTLDAATAAVVKRQGYADLDAGRRARGWARFLHTGEAFGVTGQTVAMLVSLAGAGLVWTGLALALRRLRRTVRR